jgi:hypothetical protein
VTVRPPGHRAAEDHHRAITEADRASTCDPHDVGAVSPRRRKTSTSTRSGRRGAPSPAPSRCTGADAASESGPTRGPPCAVAAAATAVMLCASILRSSSPPSAWAKPVRQVDRAHSPAPARAALKAHRQPIDDVQIPRDDRRDARSANLHDGVGRRGCAARLGASLAGTEAFHGAPESACRGSS